MTVIRCASCGTEQDSARSVCRVCGAMLHHDVPESQMLATGDIVAAESGNRAMKLLLGALVLFVVLGIIGAIVMWWVTYRESENKPFVMERPAIVAPLGASTTA